MVAAEAAAAGCPPLVARHSGLAEVAAGPGGGVPAELRHLPRSTGDAADLASGSRAARARRRRAPRRACARASAVVERWSWAGVAPRACSTRPFA